MLTALMLSLLRLRSIWFCLMTSSCYMAFKVVCTAHELCCTLFLMHFKIWNLKLLKLCDSHRTRNTNEGLIKYYRLMSLCGLQILDSCWLCSSALLSPFLNSPPPPTCSVRFSLSMAFPSVSRRTNIGLVDTIRASVWHGIAKWSHI